MPCCRRGIGLIALLTCQLCMAMPAWGQDQRGFAKEGAYVGLAGLPNFTLDAKTFDGETIYKEIGGEELGILPRLDTRNVIKFVTGFRARQAALEFSYERTKHDGVWRDLVGEATFNSINIDAKVFFNTRSRVQPHVVVGLAFPWLRVINGAFSSDQPDAEVGDGRWRGPGLNTEAGVTAFITPRAGVSVGYAYRFIWFNRARGVSEKIFELKPPFGESSANVVILGFFTF